MKKTVLLIIALFVSFFVCGCGTRLYVMNYPAFFTNDSTYSSIAVAPVQNDYEYGRWTNRVNRELVYGYMNNGYYAVYDNTGGGNAMGDLEVFTTIANYGENRDERIDTRTETRKIYKLDGNGNRVHDANGNPIVERVENHEVKYKVFERTSYANLSVVVLESASGTTLYDKVIGGSCYEESPNPRQFSPVPEARWCALSDAVSSVVYQTSPTSDVIVVDDDDVLAIHRYDAEDGWVDDSDIAPDGTFRLSVAFPNAALYNTFGIDIVSGENNDILIQEKVYWEGNTFQFEYKMADLIAKSGGMPEYKVRIWNAGRVAIEKEIEVDQ